MSIILILALQEDTLRTYYLKAAEVRAKALPFSESSNIVEISRNALEIGDFTLIKKGPFSPDLYLEGFKKGDISVSIEGERAYNACPNRMDAGILRYYSLHYSNISISGSSANLQAGIGGIAHITRKPPTQNLTYEALGEIRSNGLGGQASATISLYNQRFSFAYLLEKDYRFGKNSDTLPDNFLDRYGYYKDTTIYNVVTKETLRIKDNITNYYILSYTGQFGKYQLNGDFSHAVTVLFPYLMMDEIGTKMLDLSLKHMDFGKIYFNYTHHPMSNKLRKNQKMYMLTDAKKSVIGYVGAIRGVDIDAFYRGWNTTTTLQSYMDTTKKKVMNTIDNYREFRITGAYKFDTRFARIIAKAGINYETAGYDGQTVRRLDLVGAMDISKPFLTKYGIITPVLEMAMDNPDPTYRYFHFVGMRMVKPNMNNPQYFCVKKILGDTLLRPSKKVALGIITNYLTGKINYVKDYAYFTGKIVWDSTTTPYPTMYKIYNYENIDALIASLSLKYDFRNLIRISASYTYGRNLTYDRPMPEIMPLRFQITAITPEWKNMKAEISYQFTASKDSTSIDPILEIPTPSYNLVNLSVKYTRDNLEFTFGVDNLLNTYYYEPLSYARDPFAASSGRIIPVYERGRSFYLKFYYKNF